MLQSTYALRIVCALLDEMEFLGFFNYEKYKHVCNIKG